VTQVRTISPIWHVYGAVLPEGQKLAGCWLTVTLELEIPQEMPPFWKSDDDDETLWEGLPYLASFDHAPSEEEMEALRDAVDPADV
jgi:hypothetical protein